MSRAIALLLSIWVLLSGCDSQTVPLEVEQSSSIRLNGKWIMDQQGKGMLDPQPSGLIFHGGELLMVADGSAEASQQHKLHRISPQDMTLSAEAYSIKLSHAVARSCFAQYLKDEPDYEGLAKDPDQQGVFYLVTEDATRTGTLSRRCEQKYQDTGSTDYPTLLVRLQLSDQQLLLTHVRPLQFSPEDRVGNFPNDGIEGISFGPERTLFLALEKDAAGQPRIFSLEMGDKFWDSKNFARVQDANLNVPKFKSGNHPINGLAYYPGTGKAQGFLVAAARNDNQLWLIDLDGKKQTTVLDLTFWAEADPSASQCEPWELLDNTSIEGVVVQGDNIWIVNDPWKKHYQENIQCELNREKFERNAPLLFNLPVQQAWFTSPVS